MHGCQTNYYPNGNTWIREFFHNDKQEGEHKVYYDGGRVYSRTFYRNELIDGWRQFWYQNGLPEEFHLYRDNYCEGERKSWNSNGNLKIYQYYRNGDISDFTLKKKFAILTIRKRLCRHLFISAIDAYIIPDLSSII